MIRICITFLLAATLADSLPNALRASRMVNLTPAEEINDLVHHHQPRSIGHNPPSSNNIEDTVKEVEAMLKANPDLPRLTRGEILDLLENITKTDKLAGNSVYHVTTTPKNRDAKAFMVVMPFTPGNTNGNGIEELYTKTPVTHIVGAHSFGKSKNEVAADTKPKKKSQIDGTVDGTNKPAGDGVKKFQGNPHRRTTQSPTVRSSTDITSTVRNKYRRRKPHPIEQQTSTTAVPLATTYSPRGRRPIRRRPERIPEKHPNHKYPEEFSEESAKSSTPLPSNGWKIIGSPNHRNPGQFSDESVRSSTPLPSSGLKIISSPKLSPHVINDDLLLVEDQHEGDFVEKDVPFSIERVTIRDIDLDHVGVGSSTNLMKVDIPGHLKEVVADMDLESALRQGHQKRSTTPKPLSTKEEELEIKKMLASLGVLPVQTSTTTTQLPDISNVADNLSPEMKDLLMSFGLIPNTQQKPVSASQVSDNFNPVKAEITPESYVGFKPLPEDNESRDEMEELLARFGLGRSSRKRKELGREENKKTTLPRGDEKTALSEEKMNFEMVPEEYQTVLEDIGLSKRDGKMIRSASLIKTQEKQHVFNPTDNKYATEAELDKLNNLMAIIKQLESLNRTVTEEDLNEIDKKNLKDLVESLSGNEKIVPLDEQTAPDPLQYDYGLSRNEVKRQENITSSTESVTAVNDDVTPNIKDLEESFGGMTDPVTEPPPETTTASRRTGFYYLVDWNTFLDIDDQKGKRVNLRFQPTIGDPKRFYSVSVP